MKVLEVLDLPNKDNNARNEENTLQIG